jgi:hypothetical protein
MAKIRLPHWLRLELNEFGVTTAKYGDLDEPSLG